eukprot:c518_g2_i1 orf=72-299(+)
MTMRSSQVNFRLVTLTSHIFTLDLATLGLHLPLYAQVLQLLELSSQAPNVHAFDAQIFPLQQTSIEVSIAISMAS